jgi:hypothetical protein
MVSGDRTIYRLIWIKRSSRQLMIGHLMTSCAEIRCDRHFVMVQLRFVLAFLQKYTAEPSLLRPIPSLAVSKQQVAQ